MNTMFSLQRFVAGNTRSNASAAKAIYTPFQPVSPLKSSGVDSIHFEGKKAKAPMTESAKLIIQLTEETLKGELEWKRVNMEVPDDGFVTSGATTKLKDGRTITVGGDFLDRYSMEGAHLMVKEPGRGKKAQYQQLEDNSEFRALDVFNKAWMLHAWGPDEDNTAKDVEKELKQYRREFA